MTRPRIADLFCGAGGAAVGYARAGFEVVGVDINPQPRYPFEFHQADALDYPLDGFDVIHASPPCQAFTEAATSRKGDHPDLLTPTRVRLRTTGRPYVIENVPNAPMPAAIVLCGSAFGLPLIRHRLFEVEPFILNHPQCFARRFGRATDHGPAYAPYASGSWEARWRAEVLPAVWPWMTLQESGQAIPPAYTEWIGGQLMAHLKEQAA